MAKQLDCTTSIASTQNNGIHNIHIGPHTTFTRLSHVANTQKPFLTNMAGVDWTTTKSNHSNQQMFYKSWSLISIAVSAMIVGLKITLISLAYYTTGIFSNVSSLFCHISQFRHTLILNRCTSLTPRVVQSTVRRTWVIGGGIKRINLLAERQLYQSYVHPTTLTRPIF